MPIDALSTYPQGIGLTTGWEKMHFTSRGGIKNGAADEGWFGGSASAGARLGIHPRACRSDCRIEVLAGLRRCSRLRLRRTGEPETSGVSYSLDFAELTDAELRKERLVARQMREKCASDGRPEASLLADLVHLCEDERHRRPRSRAISDLVEKG
jgi:hypothetical protein